MLVKFDAVEFAGLYVNTGKLVVLPPLTEILQSLIAFVPALNTKKPDAVPPSSNVTLLKVHITVEVVPQLSLAVGAAKLTTLAQVFVVVFMDILPGQLIVGGVLSFWHCAILD